MGKRIFDWQRSIEQKWASLSFGQVKHESRDGQHFFEVEVNLSDLDPKAVLVELYAESVTRSPAARQEMDCIRQIAGAPGNYIYAGSVSDVRPALDYTARIIPRHDGVSVPLEENHVLWHH